MPRISGLPLDVALLVFNRLPVKAVQRLRRVHSWFRTTIDDNVQHTVTPEKYWHNRVLALKLVTTLSIKIAITLPKCNKLM